MRTYTTKEGLLVKEEIWPIKGFEDYLVSNAGYVISLKRNNPTVLKTKISGTNRYHKVLLYTNGVRVFRPVHQLVYETFIGKRDLTKVVDHTNNDRNNNNVMNLREITQEENILNRELPNKTSKYRGVYYQKRNGLWMARKTVGKRLRFIGNYKTEDEAAQAYDNWTGK